MTTKMKKVGDFFVLTWLIFVLTWLIFAGPVAYVYFARFLVCVFGFVSGFVEHWNCTRSVELDLYVLY